MSQFLNKKEERSNLPIPFLFFMAQITFIAAVCALLLSQSFISGNFISGTLNDVSSVFLVNYQILVSLFFFYRFSLHCEQECKEQALP